MVRRLPTPRELAGRRVIQITPRDRRILQAVYKHGFMTVEQIELAFFPPPAARTSPSSAAYERVRQLWLWGYLERVELPVPRMLGGRLPCLFALGRKAVSVVAADLGKGTRPVHQRRLDRLDDQNIDHDLKAAAFWAHLRALIRGKKVKSWHWTSERDIKAERRRIKDPETNKWLPVIPDGEFRLVYPSGDVQYCFLEIDMDSMPEKRIRQKMRAFDLYLTRAMRPPDVLDCVEAVAAHLAYAPTVPVPTQRQFLAWTFGEPKVGGSCQMPDCRLPKELPHPWHEVPDDRVQHKFGHALQDLLLDALRHKCPVNRGLGMPLIHGLSGNVHVRHIIVGNPYVYYPS